MKAVGGIEDCRTCFIEPPKSLRGMGAFKSGANVEPVNDQKNRR